MTTFFDNVSAEVRKELQRIANAIVAPGKGILAADVSVEMKDNQMMVNIAVDVNAMTRIITEGIAAASKGGLPANASISDKSSSS
uniref:fructose-bisphosphate aldolase n=1 Tax=Mesocestoides corti TaxID=53468 RepID=A0A5K3FTZ6_MESCO